MADSYFSHSDTSTSSQTEFSSPPSNRCAAGILALVWACLAVAGGKTLMQYHDGKSGYLSQSLIPLYFGLGHATKVDSVDEIWPSGRRQTSTEQLPINALLRITEGKD